MARPTLMAMSGPCPDAPRECDMKPHPERSVLASVVGCLAVTATVVVMTTTAAFAGPKSSSSTSTRTSTTANGHAAKASSTTHANDAHASSASDHSAGNASTVGDSTQPQPLSGADQNSGGANGQCPGGPYCSTRDGSASGNGNGGGQAVGKPCAGCVGKADNKNPKGQMPNGSDHNAGYECDRNHGIARTNPAHTGCTSTPPPCDEATEDCDNPPPCDEATEDCDNPPPCDEATEDCGNPPPCDEATEDCGNPPPAGCVPAAANNFCTDVLGEKVVRPAPQAEVLGEAVVSTPTALPFTGSRIDILFPAALLALVCGSGLLVVARRRRRA